MARGISHGTNARLLDDTVAETGPGIPDDAVGEGQLLPEEIAPDADAVAEALHRKGWDKPQD